jgi:hypothetical protein
VCSKFVVQVEQNSTEETSTNICHAVCVFSVPPYCTGSFPHIILLAFGKFHENRRREVRASLTALSEIELTCVPVELHYDILKLQNTLVHCVTFAALFKFRNVNTAEPPS